MNQVIETVTRNESIVVLVAEDDEFDRAVLEQVISELELNVTLEFVIDGEDLLDYLHRRGIYKEKLMPPFPAVLILDLNMPRLNGIEALQMIRADARLKMLPVIVLSTTDNPKQIELAYLTGVNAFLTKPGNLDDFTQLVKSFHSFWLERVKLPPLTASGSVSRH